MEKFNKLAIMGAIIIFCVAGFLILTSVNLTDFITQFTAILIGLGIALLSFAFRHKFEKITSNSKYTPNPQEYRTHIQTLRNHIRANREGSNAKSYFNIMKDSDFREQLIQHMFTYFSYKEEKIPSIFDKFLMANSIQKFDIDYRLVEEFLKQFDSSFEHIYQTMISGHPVIGACDACKTDYYDTNRKEVLKALQTYHRNEDEIRKMIDGINPF